MPIALQQVLYGSGVGIVYDVNAVKAALKWSKLFFSLGIVLAGYSYSLVLFFTSIFFTSIFFTGYYSSLVLFFTSIILHRILF